MQMGSLLRQSGKLLRGVFWQLFCFEFVFRMVRNVLVRPLLAGVMQVALALSGYHLAFNQTMRDFLLTPWGLLGGAIYVAVSALFIYFEFAVIILVAWHQCEGKKVPTRQVIKEALVTLPALGGPGFLGFCIYAMLLLPFMGTGVSSALIPEIQIPAFISGEMMKTWYGLLGLLVLMVISFWLVRALLFVLPVMVIETARFPAAVRRSWQMRRWVQKRTILVFFLFFAGWYLLRFLSFLLQLALLGQLGGDTMDIMLVDEIADMGTFGRYMGVLLLQVADILFSIVLTPLRLSLQVVVYRVAGRPQPAFNYTRLAWLDSWVLRANAAVDRFLAKLSVLREKPERRRRLVRRVRKLVGLLCLVLLLLGTATVGVFETVEADQQFIIGHRGSKNGVENTLEALQDAIDAGADYAEIDILLSRDSVPMVIHDATLRRLAGESKNVGDLTAEELGSFTLRQDGHEGRISTLEEVLRFCDGRINLLIEFKEHGQETESVVAKTLEVVEQQGFENQAIYHTMLYDCLQEAKQLRPDYSVGFITYGAIGQMRADDLTALGADFIVVEEDMVSDRLMAEASQASMPVFVWTVNDADKMMEFFKRGATAVITDYPHEGGEVLTELEQWLQQMRAAAEDAS